jgi:tight adherence protein C
MELIIALVLVVAAVYLIAYQFMKPQISLEEAHLSAHEFKDEEVDILKPQIADDEIGMYRKSWLPLSSQFKNLARRMPRGKVYRRLIKAGSPMGLLEFYTLKLLTTLLVPVLALIFIGDVFSNQTTVLLVSLAAGFLIPDLWLSSLVKKRINKIRKDLPSIIDLLELCVSGGLDFMMAVNRVVRDMRRCDLTIELEEVYRQTQMGKSRKEALKNLAWRIDIPETYSFVRTLIQADRMGSPVSEALKMQSEEIRTRRFQRGEAMALKAPIKLLFPLFAFILPVVLVIVGAPIILQFTRGSLNVGF